MPTPNLNWVKALDADQQYAAELSNVARWEMFEAPSPDIEAAIYYQEKAAAEYEACRSVYQLLFQES